MSLVVEVEKHALEVHPEECVGYVSNGEYIRLENTSSTPELNYRLNIRVKIMLAGLKTLEALVHSHPILDSTPSERDLQAQKSTGYTFWIIGTDGKTTTTIRKII